MSLSTLRNILNSPASPLRLVKVSVRLSSTSSLSSPPFASSSSTSSTSSGAHSRSGRNEGGDRSDCKRRYWHRRVALGLLFGGGVLLTSPFIHRPRRLDSLVPTALAADGSVAHSNVSTLSVDAADDDPVSASPDLDAVDSSSDAESLHAAAPDSPEAAKQTDSLSKATITPIDVSSPEKDGDADSNVIESSECPPGEAKKKRIGFRDRRIIEYENRIRAYSTPDKVFRYFASLQAKPEIESNSEVFMTPEDFVRSLTPGAKQPEGLGLDQFLRIDPNKFKAKCATLPEDSIFFKLAENGLLTFSDYLFLLTMLSTPPRHFEMAFKMFDFNGDGNVDFAEFQKVQNILRSRTTAGRRHRDHSNTGSVMKSIQPALTSYFFGHQKDEKLTVEKFIHFQEELQKEILRIEFHRYDLNADGTLKETDFADCLLTHACLSDKRVARMKRRVKKAFEKKDEEGENGEEEETPEKSGIAFEEFVDFFSFLHHINDVECALTFYHVAGAAIDKATFRHVARTVAGVRATDHVIDVIFVLFDENLDEHLSHKEFISVMKQRGMRGLQKSRDTGFTNLLTAMWKCGKIQAYDKIVYGDYDHNRNHGGVRRRRF